MKEASQNSKSDRCTVSVSEGILPELKFLFAGQIRMLISDDKIIIINYKFSDLVYLSKNDEDI